jgi:hypothetical protein
MAVDTLSAAKQLISSRGVQPPAGIAAGTPQYDQWAQNWFNAALDAGDPEVVKAAGGIGVADQGEGYTGEYAPWQDAAPYTEWMGKRKPTPRELRRWAHDTGQPEDYERFHDAQLAAWITDKWDVQGGTFLNDFGDKVLKPTESGPASSAAGFSTGEKSAGQGAPAAAAATPAAAAESPAAGEGSWGGLDQRMLDLFKEGAGYFDPSKRAGIGLQGGGMIWRDPLAQPQAGVTPQKGVASPGQPAQPFITSTSPLVSATLNAFSPQAPSKQAAAAPTTPAVPAPTPAAPATAPSPVIPAKTTTTQPATGTSPLTRALSAKYTQPNSWWMGGQKNYSY